MTDDALSPAEKEDLLVYLIRTNPTYNFQFHVSDDIRWPVRFTPDNKGTPLELFVSQMFYATHLILYSSADK